MNVSSSDPEIFSLLEGELERQRNTLGMIASENHASPAVLQAMASVLQNKYSEGYPGKRYYAGNEFADKVEQLAIDRAKKLFGAEHANVQPLAGSAANMAAYYALLEPGSRIMSLSLAHGGHLTHGSPVNFSSKLYKISHYSLNPETETLDYDAIRKQALLEKPDLILCGYTAYPREIDFKEFGDICREADAFMMADISHIAGLIAGGAHQSPVQFADLVTTTTHKTLRGPRGAIIMCKADYAKQVDKAVFPGLQGGPFDHIHAAKAVCFKEAMQPSFRQYAAQIVRNSKALAAELAALGLRLVSGGTDNHLLLADLSPISMTGKEAQERLESVGIIVNRNMVPNDKQSPFVTSGIRVGTPSLTTRGMKESEMKEIAQLMVSALKDAGAPNLEKVRLRVRQLCSQFPLYPGLRM